MSPRETLGAAQGDLIRALGGSQPAAAGFDSRRLEAMAGILAGKRKRAVASTCPLLRSQLGARFDPLFREYTRQAPLPAGRRVSSDACEFMAWLKDRRALPAGIHVVAVRMGRWRLAIAWLAAERRILFG